MSWPYLSSIDFDILAVIIASGLMTFAARFSMIGIFGNRQLPAILKRLLAYIPAAALSALILPDILLVDGQFRLLANAEIPAFIIAAIVAYRYRSIIATIATGMAALWLIEALT
jgi:branched-subunit amino acid transport protein